MFCHNKPLFRARSKGLGGLAHSVYWLAVEVELRGCTEHRVNMRTHWNCD